MDRLGHSQYVAQGGDVGALVMDLMGREAVQGVGRHHLNLLTAVLAIGDDLPRETEQERAAAAAVATFRQDGFGYFLEMATRPQTIGYALLDSLVPCACCSTTTRIATTRSWVPSSTERPRSNLDAGPDPRQHHTVLANRHGSLGDPVVLGGRTRWLQRLRVASRLRRSTCRSASLRSPANWASPRSWVEAVYPDLAYFNEADKGGYFAAWEEPEIFSAEVRVAFRPLRSRIREPED